MGTVISLTEQKELQLPQTIGGVVSALDEIIAWAEKAETPLGYFPALYRKVTLAVQAAIRDGAFDDNERMERLDVLFANRYLEAFYAFRRGAPVSSSWTTTFEAIQNPKLLIIQHLLLGMNAHINLDLGVAAAAIAPGEQIHDLRDDFMRINTILASLVDEVENEIARLSPLFGLLDWLGGRSDERTVDFGMQAARDAAWMEARRLAAVPKAARATQIEILDSYVAGLARLVYGKGRWVQRLCRFIHGFESRNIKENIAVLR